MRSQAKYSSVDENDASAPWDELRAELRMKRMETLWDQ